jgi:hypothetical protein
MCLVDRGAAKASRPIILKTGVQLCTQATSGSDNIGSPDGS